MSKQVYAALSRVSFWGIPFTQYHIRPPQERKLPDGEFSNGNASETKANESFDNGVFFNIEAKRTPSIVNKLFSKRSEHISLNKNYFRSEANKFDSKITVF